MSSAWARGSSLKGRMAVAVGGAGSLWMNGVVAGLVGLSQNDDGMLPSVLDGNRAA